MLRRPRYRAPPGRNQAGAGPVCSRRAFAALAAGAMLAPAWARAAPSAELWRRWLAHDPASSAGIDHGAWDRLLGAHLRMGADGIARFAYGEVGAAGRRALKDYIAGLAAARIGALARAEQFALWVNLYNALTVDVVLDHFPVRSIRDIDISPGLFADGPWGRKLAAVDGEKVSLDDVEHRILRPIWRDPRIHYAVNCASLGCPDLQPRAFTAANAEALLEAGAAAYVNHPRGARFDDGRLVVSSIYRWFSEDFGGSDASTIAHLRRYARPALAERLAEARRIADHDYDWRLNDWGGARRG